MILNEETAALLRQIMRQLEKLLPGLGISLVCFEMDKIEPGQLNWISNCKREDVTVIYRELIAQLEGHHHDAPRAKHEPPRSIA